MSERPTVLILGNGGREHAFATALGSDVDIVVSPGNAGTAQMENVTNLEIDDPVAYARETGIDLAIIGPEAPLVKGVADQFRAAGIDVVGPNRVAAQLESSKSFATDFMERQDIPHPKSWTVHSLDQYHDLTLRAQDIVIKADGLAGGKGVVLPETNLEADKTLAEMFAGAYDNAGSETIVIQERLSGPEVSVFVLTDGTDIMILPTAQDHKRLLNRDEGPNTGGMGAYTPVPETILSERQFDKIREIAEKTVAGMRAEGNEYRGILYIGTMLADQYDGDPVVIEYNARFGDPEAQAILSLMQRSDTDVLELFRSTDNKLDPSLLDLQTVSKLSALTITLAAEGYPESPRKGDRILGLQIPHSKNLAIHHGGTKFGERKGKQTPIVTNGGRVLYLTGIGQSLDDAAEEAYNATNFVHFKGIQYRTDIGAQALRHL